jgi:hypothetical protein
MRLNLQSAFCISVIWPEGEIMVDNYAGLAYDARKTG